MQIKESFSKRIKKEILSVELENDCCSIAFLSAVLKGSGELGITGGNLSAHIITDVQELFPFISKIVKKLYGDEAHCEIFEDFVVNRTPFFKISLPQKHVQRILSDTQIAVRDGDGSLVLVKGIAEYLIMEDCCKKSYVKGAFVGCGTSSIKISENLAQKTSTGYHIEFSSINHDFISDFAYILSDFNILTKTIKRKDHLVLYVKDSSFVSDVLALMDSFNCVLALQNEMVAREMRNKVNRQTNCLSANISKTVEASMKQAKAIQFIIKTVGIDALSQDLQEVAFLRLANSEESLADLLKLSSIKLTKSGLNHRLKKIVSIAEKIKENIGDEN